MSNDFGMKRTIDVSRIPPEHLRLGALVFPPTGEQRPRTRGDCSGGPRPCPWVSCKHHLYLDVDPRNGNIKINAVGREPHELQVSCSLDVADAGRATLEAVGALLGLTRQAVGEIERRVWRRLRHGEDRDV